MDVIINYKEKGYAVAIKQLRSIENAGGKVGASTQRGFQGLSAAVFAGNAALQAMNIAFNAVAGAGSYAYEVLIAQNDRYIQAVNRSAAGIAANLNVYEDGQLVKGTSDQLDILIPKLAEAKNVYRGLLNEISGESAEQANAVFDVLSTNAAQLVGQSKETQDVFQILPQLAQEFTAGIVASGTPLVQARQEILAILNGRIDRNAALANFLQITNDDIKRMKEAGTLVDDLSDRLSALKEAGARNADTLSAQTEVLQDQFKQIGLEIGAPIYEALAATVKEITQRVEQMKPVITIISREILGSIAISLSAVLGFLAKGADLLGRIIAPIIDRLPSEARQLLAPLSNVSDDLKSMSEGAQTMAENILTGTTNAEKMQKATGEVTVDAQKQAQIAADHRAAEEAAREREQRALEERRELMASINRESEASFRLRISEAEAAMQYNANLDISLAMVERAITIEDSRLNKLNLQTRELQQQLSTHRQLQGLQSTEFDITQTNLTNEIDALQRIEAINLSLLDAEVARSKEGAELMKERQVLFDIVGKRYEDNDKIALAIAEREREQLALQREQQTEALRNKLFELDIQEQQLALERERLQLQQVIAEKEREIAEIKQQGAVDSAVFNVQGQQRILTELQNDLALTPEDETDARQELLRRIQEQQLAVQQATIEARQAELLLENLAQLNDLQRAGGQQELAINSRNLSNQFNLNNTRRDQIRREISGINTGFGIQLGERDSSLAAQGGRIRDVNLERTNRAFDSNIQRSAFNQGVGGGGSELTALLDIVNLLRKFDGRLTTNGNRSNGNQRQNTLTADDIISALEGVGIRE